MNDEICHCNLRCVLQEDAVWTVVTQETQRLLDQHVVGIVHCSEQMTRYIAEIVDTPSEANCCIFLSLFEALYYFNDIQIFSSTSDGSQPITKPEFERYCNEKQRHFQTLFRVFVHFKNKGWFLRSGVNYGSDFVLYDQHPSAVHAAYSVVILHQGESISLLDLQATYRLCNQVSKGLLLVQASDEIEIREVKRWISSRNQD